MPSQLKHFFLNGRIKDLLSNVELEQYKFFVGGLVDTVAKGKPQGTATMLHEALQLPPQLPPTLTDDAQNALRELRTTMVNSLAHPAFEVLSLSLQGKGSSVSIFAAPVSAASKNSPGELLEVICSSMRYQVSSSRSSEARSEWAAFVLPKTTEDWNKIAAAIRTVVAATAGTSHPVTLDNALAEFMRKLVHAFPLFVSYDDDAPASLLEAETLFEAVASRARMMAPAPLDASAHVAEGKEKSERAREKGKSGGGGGSKPKSCLLCLGVIDALAKAGRSPSTPPLTSHHWSSCSLLRMLLERPDSRTKVVSLVLSYNLLRTSAGFLAVADAREPLQGLGYAALATPLTLQTSQPLKQASAFVASACANAPVLDCAATATLFGPATHGELQRKTTGLHLLRVEGLAGSSVLLDTEAEHPLFGKGWVYDGELTLVSLHALQAAGWRIVAHEALHQGPGLIALRHADGRSMNFKQLDSLLYGYVASEALALSSVSAHPRHAEGGSTAASEKVEGDEQKLAKHAKLLSVFRKAHDLLGHPSWQTTLETLRAKGLALPASAGVAAEDFAGVSVRQLLGDEPQCAICEQAKLKWTKRVRSVDELHSAMEAPGAVWTGDILQPVKAAMPTLYMHDKATGYKLVIRLPNKEADVLASAVMRTAIDLQRFGRKFRRLHLDDEPTCVSLRNLLAVHGIEVVLTSPGQHNKDAERGVQTLLMGARAMVAQLAAKGRTVPKLAVPWLLTWVAQRQNLVLNTHTRGAGVIPAMALFNRPVPVPLDGPSFLDLVLVEHVPASRDSTWATARREPAVVLYRGMHDPSEYSVCLLKSCTIVDRRRVVPLAEPNAEWLAEVKAWEAAKFVWPAPELEPLNTLAAQHVSPLLSRAEEDAFDGLIGLPGVAAQPPVVSHPAPVAPVVHFDVGAPEPASAAPAAAPPVAPAVPVESVAAPTPVPAVPVAAPAPVLVPVPAPSSAPEQSVLRPSRVPRIDYKALDRGEGRALKQADALVAAGAFGLSAIARALEKEDLLKKLASGELEFGPLKRAEHVFPMLLREAKAKEFAQLCAQEAFQPRHVGEVPREALRAAMHTLPVVTIKPDGDGGAKVKFRLTVNGSQQKLPEGHPTAVHVLSPSAFKVLMVMSCQLRVRPTFLDLTQAFTNAIPSTPNTLMWLKKDDADVLLEQCEEREVWERFRTPDGRLLVELKRALYGLKNAPRDFDECNARVLHKLGFVRDEGDPSLFVHTPRRNVGGTFVDDFTLVIADRQETQKLVAGLRAAYPLGVTSRETPTVALGMTVRFGSTNEWCTLDLREYTAALLAANSISATAERPYFDDLFALGDEHDLHPDSKRHLSVLMSVAYLVTMGIRPDIALPVSVLQTRLAKPTRKDWRDLRKILEYLNGTRNFGLLVYPDPKLGIEAVDLVADASFDVHPRNHASHGGHVVTVAGTPVVVASKVVKTPRPESSTTAEALALHRGCLSLQAVRTQVEALGFPLRLSRAFQDNHSTITLVNEGVGKALNTKALARKVISVKAMQEDRMVRVLYQPTDVIVADALTKPVPVQKFLHFRNRIHVVDVERVHLTGVNANPGHGGVFGDRG